MTYQIDKTLVDGFNSIAVTPKSMSPSLLSRKGELADLFVTISVDSQGSCSCAGCGIAYNIFRGILYPATVVWQSEKEELDENGEKKYNEFTIPLHLNYVPYHNMLCCLKNVNTKGDC